MSGGGVQNPAYRLFNAEKGVRFPVRAPSGGAGVAPSVYPRYHPTCAKKSGKPDIVFDMKHAALAEEYVSLRRDYNDLRVVSGADVDPSGFTLLAILRNEMYFLPEFLSHYRKLGVERFVFLNDRSDDGSFEYICKQPDTVVVESSRAYGDSVEIPPQLSESIRNLRIMDLWRSMLHERFAQDRWALQVDLDEFVRLPEGMAFQDLLAQLDKQDVRAVWGVMIDVYPKNIASLAEPKNAVRIDPSATWYFDGEMHVRLRNNKKPKTVYPGTRSRLYHMLGVDNLYPRRKKPGWLKHKWFGKLLLGDRFPKYVQLLKPTLLKWRDDSFFGSSHQTNLTSSNDYLLPIQHFRFTGSLYRRIEMALHEKSYHGESFDYRRLSALLQIMEEKNSSFLYPNSRPLESFKDFVETHNSRGL